MAIERCKPCANPHDSSDMPKYLPAGLTQYVLNNFSKKSPPYHVTQDDASTPLQRLEVETITGHQSVRGRRGIIAVIYNTYWVGLSEPSWQREMDLHLSRSYSLRHLAGAPDQHRQTIAFTAGCGLVWHRMSSPGTTWNVFWRRATLVSHGCGGLEKSVRV